MKTCLHNHFKSEFDAVDNIKSYLKAVIAQGYDCVAVTDHGSVAALNDVYDLVLPEDSEFHNLKIIYGTEAYVELADMPVEKKTGHLILMAQDKQGKTAIDKLLSKAYITKTGKPVLTREMLENMNDLYKGHIFATSACIAGAPAMAFQINAIYQKEIDKLQNKLKKEVENQTLDFNNIEEIQKKFDEIVAKVVELREEKKQLTKLSKRSFVAAEKKVQKLLDLNDPKAKEFEKDLQEKKKESADAKIKISKAEDQIDELWAERGKLNSLLKEYAAFQETTREIEQDIEKCKSLMLSMDDCRQKAEEEILYFNNLFGHKRYLIEVQYHGVPEEKVIYPELVKLAEKLNIPIVAANDAHVPTKSQADLDKRRVANFLRFEQVSSEEQDKTDSELYIKNQDELRDALLQILPATVVEKAINNANKIGDLCVYVPKKESHYPVFDKTQDSNVLLRKIAYDGIKWRFPNGGWTEEYQKRLDYELDVICNMGYADYHLIVKDFLEFARACGPIPPERLSEAPLSIEGVKQFCKENGWTVGMGVGIGRGSAAGSLVCYNIGITSVDPLKYDLLFERFLNVERVSMPDIDSDFRTDIREHTVKYVQKKYGHDAVVSILTESRQGVKGAIRDATRYIGKRDFNNSKQFLALGNSIRKKVPNVLNIKFDTEVSEGKTCYEFLMDSFNDSFAKKIIDLARNIEGMFTTYGMHAAGVIIPDTEDITDYIPLRWNAKKNRYTTQCNMVQAEENGLLKMDFLGLKNLDIFSETARLVEEQSGEKIDLENIPFEDEVFEEIFAKGRTKNVFQFESAGMRKYLKALHPENIEDVIAMNALYRPGPMDSIPEFIQSKNK